MIAVHLRRFKLGHDLLVDPMRPLRRPQRTIGLPSLIVAPIADKRLVERALIAVLRVLAAKVMPARTHFANGINRDVILGRRPDRLFEIALDHLQDFAVHDELLGRGDQPPFKPTRRVIDHVGAALHRRPKAVRGFPHRLPVRHVGRTDPRRAQGQLIMAHHLARHLRCPHVFRRAKGRRT